MDFRHDANSVSFRDPVIGGDAGPWGTVGAPELDQLFASRGQVLSIPFGKVKSARENVPSVRVDLSKTGMCGLIFFCLTSHAKLSAEPDHACLACEAVRSGRFWWRRCSLLKGILRKLGRFPKLYRQNAAAGSAP
jgi:hypothetical protein